jgi:hypothetical protein
MKLGHDPVQDTLVRGFIDSVCKNISLDSLGKITQQAHDQAWRRWLTDSKNNIVTGLDSLSYSCFSPGTTPAFGDFIARHSRRRIRVSRNDFVLTRILCRSWSRSWLPLEEGALEKQDCVIISLPFSGNGNLYPGWHELLDQADDLAVPVMIDAAYFGISHGVRYDLDRSCISDVAISHTKAMSGNELRLGVRFTRQQHDDVLSSAQIGSDIFDRLGAYISMQIMKEFSHDWFVHRYRDLSRGICHANGLWPTNVLTLGRGPDDWEHFRRGDYTRVCITDEIQAARLDLDCKT